MLVFSFKFSFSIAKKYPHRQRMQNIQEMCTHWNFYIAPAVGTLFDSEWSFLQLSGSTKYTQCRWLVTLDTFILVFCLCWEVVGKFGCFVCVPQWKAAKKLNIKISAARGRLSVHCFQSAVSRQQEFMRKNYVKQKRSFCLCVYVCTLCASVCVLCNETGKPLLLMKTREMCKCYNK